MQGDQGKRKITVSINDQNYTISGNADVSHIKEVASLVDQKMKEMKKRNPYLDRSQLAVLTALNISDEFVCLKKQVELERKKKDGEM